MAFSEGATFFAADDRHRDAAMAGRGKRRGMKPEEDEGEKENKEARAGGRADRD